MQQVESIFASGENESSNRAYQQLLLQETQTEAEMRAQIEDNAELDEDTRAKELKANEESFYYRRIINATYYKQIKHLILTGDYL